MAATCLGVRSSVLLAGKGRAFIPTASPLDHEVVRRWTRSARWNPGCSSRVFRDLLLVDHLLLDVVARSLLRRNEGADQPENRKDDAHDAQHGVALAKSQDADGEEAADVKHREN